MSYSFVSHLSCPKCRATYPTEERNQLCQCGSPLLVQYHFDELRKTLTPDHLVGRVPSLWRYHELLPIKHPHNVVTLGEGMTPLLPLPKLGQHMDIPRLFVKDEGNIPTGSFKARGAAVGISKAKELGVTGLILPTNGNAGAAWALYAARAGIRSTVVMPFDSPGITKKECAVSGANLFLVHGVISDASKWVNQMIAKDGLYDASTLKEPYRIEGKKTMGIEIAEQLGWKMPDVILYPTGGGVGLIGIYKGLKELQEIGWVKGKLPRLVAVQAAGCAPIVKAWKERKTESEYWAHPRTVAFGINVPKALGDFLVLDALYQTDGCAVAVEDKALLAEQRKAAEMEGIFVCPEGAAVFAAARLLRENGWIQKEETVIALNTGTGLKYPDTVQVQAFILESNAC